MTNRPWLRIILAVILAIIVALVIIVALQPSEFRVARTLAIGAPPDAVFPHVNELKKWAAWNPWEKLDPNMKLTYAGPASGTGASYSWTGNREVGEGRMTITDSRPNEAVRFRLEFFKPMAGTSDADFTFTPQDNRTEVTWSMSGRNNFIGRAMCLVMDMDAMIGGQFEKGLADLKAIAEDQVAGK